MSPLLLGLLVLTIPFVSATGPFKFAPDKPWSAVLDSSTGEWRVVSGTSGVATAILANTGNSTGMYSLQVTTSSSATDGQQAFASGFIEGALAQPLMWDDWMTFTNGTNVSPIHAKVADFVVAQDAWVRTQAKVNSSSAASNALYWAHVGLVLRQFDGLVQGYNQYAPSDQQLAHRSLLVRELVPEMGDIATALKVPLMQTPGVWKGAPYKHSPLPADTNNLPDTPPHLLGTHCSSLVKPTPDGKKLFASHVTWSGLDSMLRVYKHYTHNFHTQTAAPSVSFSSYPTDLKSVDDFYITSAQLVVMETTFGVMNQSLFRFVTERTVPYWIRSIVANRMASSGKEWADVFAMFNSGTYNNEWIVVDGKKFKPGSAQPLQDGLLWIAEQIPGQVERQDMTFMLRAEGQGYWPSYNIPFFPHIYNITDYNTYYFTVNQFDY